MSAPEALLDRLGRAVGNALQVSGHDAGTAWTELAGLGLFGLGVPVDLGGLGLGERAAAAACRALGRELEQAGCRDTLLAVDCLVAAGVEPRAGLLADLMAGRLRCRALAWPGAGPPAGDATDAVAGADPGLTWEPAADGGAGVRLVPAADAVHLGADAAALVTGRARVRQAAYLCGLAWAAHERAVARAAGRRQFGGRLLEFQAIAQPLAALAVRLDAADLLVARAAALGDAGRPSGLAALEALGQAAELALDVTRIAMQVHGASGLLLASPAQRFYRAAAVEAVRLGRPPALWEEAGRRRLARALETGRAWTWERWPAVGPALLR